MQSNKNMKTTNYLLLAATFIMSLLSVACDDKDEPIPPAPTKETVDVLTKIPDPVFKKYIQDILSEYDQDEDGKLSEGEAADVDQLDLTHWRGNSKIESLQGIEYFTGLRILNCGWNKLTTIDLSKNVKLIKLSCGNNNLSTLNLTNNPELKEVLCSDMNLKKLDISKNVELAKLYCQNNKLETLSFCKESLISELYCRNNLLKILDLNNTSRLDILDCSINQLATLNLNENKWISRLICNNNQLTSLVIGDNKLVFEVNCSQNQLKTVDTKMCTELGLFYCENNLLQTLNLTFNTCLVELKAKENPSLNDICVWRGFSTSEIELFEVPANVKIIEQDK